MGKGTDGSVPFENGVGRIYYQMPVDEYLDRQAKFEALIEEILNTCIEPDDDEYEIAFKLYNYMSSNFVYQTEFQEKRNDGSCYLTLMEKTGQCTDLANLYAYLLLQSGVEAILVGCNNESMGHDWTYVVINGKGYHCDPTWSLYSPKDGESLRLDYFMMTGDKRADSGCAVDDLEAALLPAYWVNRSNTRLTADDDSLGFPAYTYFVSLDEDNKKINYSDVFGSYELSYAANE